MYLLHALVTLLVIGTIAAINQQCEPSFNGNDTCPPNAYCMDNRYCACQSGFIGDCSIEAHNLTDQLPTTKNISHDEITLFSVTPNTSDFVILVF